MQKGRHFAQGPALQCHVQTFPWLGFSFVFFAGTDFNAIDSFPKQAETLIELKMLCCEGIVETKSSDPSCFMTCQCHEVFSVLTAWRLLYTTRDMDGWKTWWILPCSSSFRKDVGQRQGRNWSKGSMGLQSLDLLRTNKVLSTRKSFSSRVPSYPLIQSNHGTSSKGVTPFF